VSPVLQFTDVLGMFWVVGYINLQRVLKVKVGSEFGLNVMDVELRHFVVVLN
jgi:hypothetical protein